MSEYYEADAAVAETGRVQGTVSITECQSLQNCKHNNKHKIIIFTQLFDNYYSTRTHFTTFCRTVAWMNIAC